MAFRKGAEAAEKASKSGNFQRTEFFGLDDGESAIVRFITDADAWIVVNQHQNVPTRPKPEGVEKWPERMGAVCRKDEAFEGMFEDCYICDCIKQGNGKKYPNSARTWALACLREEVIGDGTKKLGGAAMKGKKVGYRDVIREVQKTDDKGEATGDVIKEKAVVVVNLGFKNFFSIMQGFASHYGTVLDRDYSIKRKGDGLDTTYNIVPLDPVGLDLRDPDTLAKYDIGIDLEAVISERASDNYYDRFFDVRHPIPARDSDKSEGAPADQQSKPQPEEEDEAALAEMMSRVKDYSGDGGEANGQEKAAEGESESQEEEAQEDATVGASSGGLMNFDE